MKYKYLVSALAFSFCANATAQQSPSLYLPPPAPAIVTATMGSGTAVDVKWSSVSGVRSYEIRKNSSALTTVNPFVFSFRDTNVSINTDVYQVRACIYTC